MMIKIGGTGTIAAGAEPLAFVAAMIVKLGPYEKPALIKLYRLPGIPRCGRVIR
jgi:hypothetical protein